LNLLPADTDLDDPHVGVYTEGNENTLKAVNTTWHGREAILYFLCPAMLDYANLCDTTSGGLPILTLHPKP
jgi:hypothetical protein